MDIHVLPLGKGVDQIKIDSRIYLLMVNHVILLKTAVQKDALNVTFTLL